MSPDLKQVAARLTANDRAAGAERTLKRQLVKVFFMRAVALRFLLLVRGPPWTGRGDHLPPSPREGGCHEADTLLYLRAISVVSTSVLQGSFLIGKKPLCLTGINGKNY